MAIKGNSSSSNGGGNRGRPYGVMLLVAFGAALLGVLVVHKLRERRIFSILVTEKEQQLYSLHLLLQKEREESNEMRKKAEEMKVKLDTLSTQKMELDRRVLEMQSTIDSLKDEGKALEAAVEEKQNEIKELRDEASSKTSVHDGEKENDNARVAALEESVKQKEAEIQELKRRLEDPVVKVWSVGSDDPSNGVNSNGTKVVDDVGEKGKEIAGLSTDAVVNSTDGGGVSGKLPEGESGRGSDRRRLSRDKELLAEQVNNKELLAAQVTNITGVNKDIINTARGELSEQHRTKQEDSFDHDEGKISRVEGLTGSGTNESSSDAGNANSINNAGGAHYDSVENIGKGGTIRGGMMMEMKDEVLESSGKIRKHAHSRKARGKKWRMLARKRWLGNNMSHDHENAAAIDGAASQLRNSQNSVSKVDHQTEESRLATDGNSDQARSDSDGTGFKSEKGVEDADLTHQEADQSDSDPSRSRNT